MQMGKVYDPEIDGELTYDGNYPVQRPNWWATWRVVPKGEGVQPYDVVKAMFMVVQASAN